MEAQAKWKQLNFNAIQQEFESLNKLTGYGDDEASNAAIATMNTEIALASFYAQEPFDYYVQNFPGGLPDTNLSTLDASMPNLPIRRTLEKIANACEKYNTSCAGLRQVMQEDLTLFNVDMPVYHQRISEAIGEYPAESWIPFLRSHVIKGWAPVLGNQFETVLLKSSALIQGVQKAPERWHKCSNAAMNALAHTADKVYRLLYFPPAAEAEGHMLMSSIKAAFIENLKSVEWLDASTRKRALDKASALTMSLGGTNDPYYIHFPVSRTSYYNNTLHAFRAKMLGSFAEIDETMRKDKWAMAAFAVNAYYDRTVNALFIPAGVMQPPFFYPYFYGSAEAHAARNYGGIGSVIGHEFSHGFDNKGAKYDASASLKNWWSDTVAADFKVKTNCVKSLYDQFVIQSVKVDGEKTEAENIADHGGLKVSLQALKAHLYVLNNTPPLPHTPPSVSSSSSEFASYGEEISSYGKETSSDSRAVRLYFVSFGQLWCSKERQNGGYTHMQTESDPHAPGPFRTNGAVSQNEDFAVAFRCPSGSAMNPLHKCQIW